MATAEGEYILADVASPPSPLDGASAGTGQESATPVPATVDIMPVLAVTFRMRPFPESEMYMFPDASNVTFVGVFR